MEGCDGSFNEDHVNLRLEKYRERGFNVEKHPLYDTIVEIYRSHSIRNSFCYGGKEITRFLFEDVNRIYVLNFIERLEEPYKSMFLSICFD